MLDGEGGYAVWANAVPAHRSLALGALPTGLAGNVRLKPAVARDTVVAFDNAEPRDDADVVGLRREMEGGAWQAAVA
jgi:predicted homoserine dehydrogenase-like protein